MAKKINYNEASKSSKSDFSENLKTLNKSTSVKPVKTSFEKIAPTDIVCDDDFRNLFPLNEDAVNQLTERMESKGYDESQPLHLAKFLDEPEKDFVLIDGHHRLAAAIAAALDKVPVYRHTFDTRKDGIIYALELQLLRRNEDKKNLYNDFQKLKKLKEIAGTDSEEESKGRPDGKQSEKDAEKLGVSSRQIEKMNAIDSSDREDLKEQLSEGSISVNAAYDELKGTKKKSKKKADEEEISEALDDTEGNPQSVTVRSRDMSVQYNAPTESEIDKRLIERYQEGFVDGFQQAANYVLMLVLHGVSNSYIYKNIFCSKTKHNFQNFNLCNGNDPASDYDYNEFRKELLANPKVTDLNPLPLKDYSNNPNEEEYDGPGLPFEEDPEPSDKKSTVTDLNTIKDSDSAFDVF